MRIVLVGQDVAPSGAFAVLAPVLTGRGIEAQTFLGNGKPFAHSIESVREAIRGADAVLVGMSSSAELAAPEIAACEEAVSARIPFGFYGDTYHCHERAREGSWFSQFREAAAFFFAINEQEARDARSVFPKAECIATGNPLWEEFAFPKFSRGEARAKLGIQDHEFLVLSPGGKSPVVNILLWGTMLDALGQFASKNNRQVQAVLAPHPGDRTPFAIDPQVVESSTIAYQFAMADPKAKLNVYGDLLKFSPVPTRFLGEDAAGNPIKTFHVLPGADLVVEWASTICIEAAHLRIPVVSVSTGIGANRLFSTSGTRRWEPTVLGISRHSSSSPDDLAEAIQVLIEEGEATRLNEEQARVYPVPPEKGTATRLMAETLAEMPKRIHS